VILTVVDLRYRDKEKRMRMPLIRLLEASNLAICASSSHVVQKI
jgi:hypothetical protein